MSVRDPESVVELLQQASELSRDLMAENRRLRQKLGEAEVESQKFADRFAQVSEQSELLQNLFVVIHRLHASLELAEVLATLREVVINLVGSEDFGIWGIQGEAFELLAFEGEEPQIRAFTQEHSGQIREVLGGEPYFRPEGESGGLAAICPLKAGERPLGAIVIRSLLRQKPRLTDNDRQILELLSTQGAVALLSAQLYEQALRDSKSLRIEVRA